jgi:signal transduction histidine kinase
MHAGNVLLVEDDPALSTMVASVLTDAGYRPITINDHALIDSALDRWHPRCVILDGEVRSTGESRTWDDAISIRQAHPDLPVVIFTADGASLAEARERLSPRSIAAGLAGVIGKPFVVEEFLATVKSALDRPSSDIRVFPDIGRLSGDWPQSDLFSTVVHELRGPLTVIRGQVQLAQRRIGRDAKGERDAMARAIDQVDRMDQLITELLDHARLESNGLSLTVGPFDLVTAVADSIAIHDFGSVPRITFQRPLGRIPVHGDADRIAQILDNLIGNALKYSAGEAPIEVSLMMHGDEIEVRVADHGVGVPANEVGSLFTPFYRTSRTRHLPGTGLGLYISRRLAQRHGGRLWLEQTSELGSTFVLTLLLIAQDPQASLGASGRQSPA